jgi:hypothetical protein
MREEERRDGKKVAVADMASVVAVFDTLHHSLAVEPEGDMEASSEGTRSYEPLKVRNPLVLEEHSHQKRGCQTEDIVVDIPSHGSVAVAVERGHEGVQVVPNTYMSERSDQNTVLGSLTCCSARRRRSSFCS